MPNARLLSVLIVNGPSAAAGCSPILAFSAQQLLIISLHCDFETKNAFLIFCFVDAFFCCLASPFTENRMQSSCWSSACTMTSKLRMQFLWFIHALNVVLLQDSCTKLVTTDVKQENLTSFSPVQWQMSMMRPELAPDAFQSLQDVGEITVSTLRSNIKLFRTARDNRGLCSVSTSCCLWEMFYFPMLQCVFCLIIHIWLRRVLRREIIPLQLGCQPQAQTFSITSSSPTSLFRGSWQGLTLIQSMTKIEATRDLSSIGILIQERLQEGSCAILFLPWWNEGATNLPGDWEITLSDLRCIRDHN